MVQFCNTQVSLYLYFLITTKDIMLAVPNNGIGMKSPFKNSFSDWTYTFSLLASNMAFIDTFTFPPSLETSSVQFRSISPVDATVGGEVLFSHLWLSFMLVEYTNEQFPKIVTGHNTSHFLLNIWNFTTVTTALWLNCRWLLIKKWLS